MLALTRKIDERIMIGDDITVKVIEIKGDRVKLGIDAPNSIEIDREEVRESKINDGYHSPRKAQA